MNDDNNWTWLIATCALGLLLLAFVNTALGSQSRWPPPKKPPVIGCLCNDNIAVPHYPDAPRPKDKAKMMICLSFDFDGNRQPTKLYISNDRSGSSRCKRSMNPNIDIDGEWRYDGGVPQ